MNILEQVQRLVSTVFCLHKDHKECDRFAQIANQFDKKAQSIEEARQLAAENSMVEETKEDKDNFLRGSLMNTTRRRHSQTMNKIAVSYWRHGSGCSCCKESHKSEDFQKIAPTSIYNKGMLPSLSTSGYIDLTDPGMGTELQCLTSFITESGRHRILTQQFVDESMPPLTNRPKASDTLTNIAAQVRQIEDSLTELAADPDPLVRAIAAESPHTPAETLEKLLEDDSEEVRNRALETAVATGDVAPVQVDVEDVTQEPRTRRAEPTLQNLPACNSVEVATQVEITEGATSLLGRLIQKKATDAA
jgi:hypothetical protein